MLKKELRPYLILWSTQSLSALGSAMTSFALVLWLYETSGSALKTALLSVCSYAPYVLMSIFAGALSDRWNKKRTMLACDAVAAACTVAVLILLKSGTLQTWHIYALNAVSGLMNTVQQPAGDVAATLLVSREYDQKTSGLRSFSGSLNTILTPVIASALFAFSGMELVIAVDLFTFAVAFLALFLFIRIPETALGAEKKDSLLKTARSGLLWLKEHKLILNLMLFLACINLVASAYNAALPALILSRENGGETVLGLLNSIGGLATLAGSVLVGVLPAPKNRVKAVCVTLFVSMSTENLLLALGRTPFVWYLGSVLGWLCIPMMNANLDVINRATIPAEMQGRVYSCRNTFQFFTIPLGYLLGGTLVDRVFEPYMKTADPNGLPARLFGTGSGSGAAFTFLALATAGVAVTLVFSWILRNDSFPETKK